jgi:zinc D-Ala-D-Ala dipeptidase
MNPNNDKANGTARSSLEKILTHPDFVDISEFPAVRVELLYATTNNLLGKNVYDSFNRAIVHKIAAEKMKRASALLTAERPGWKFVIYDALRPQSAQIAFWNLVKDTPQQMYFADPAKGSLHSFGFAIDLSLEDASGHVLDMGTPFDDLTDLAQPKMEEQFVRSGQLTLAQYDNRLLLRGLMERAGFTQLSFEWWHYDALPGAEVRAQYKLVE